MAIMNRIFFLAFSLLIIGQYDVYGQRKIKQMDPQREEMEQEATNSEQVRWQDKMTYGGNFWFTFSSTYSMLYLQPLVGYKVTDKFMVGGGITYIYWSQEYSYYSPGGVPQPSKTISDNVFGLNFFTRRTLFGPVFVHAEYQPMNFNSYNALNEFKRIWTHAMYLGGGVNQSGAYALVLYDVLWRTTPSDPKSYSRSFYPSPWNIRIGFMF